MATGAILTIGLMSLSRFLWLICARNFQQRQKRCPTSKLAVELEMYFTQNGGVVIDKRFHDCNTLTVATLVQNVASGIIITSKQLYTNTNSFETSGVTSNFCPLPERKIKGPCVKLFCLETFYTGLLLFVTWVGHKLVPYMEAECNEKYC